MRNGSDRHGAAHGIASPHFVREANADVVLDHVWDAGPVTGTELMRATGLSRATVHGVCAELIDAGWLAETAEHREPGELGRPAKRYAFRAGAGAVVGVDAGEHRVTAVVTDLSGRTLGRVSTVVGDRRTGPDARRAAVTGAVDAALAQAGTPPSRVVAAGLGLPVPVDGHGRTAFRRNRYWEAVNPDLPGLLGTRGWTVMADNDANLAALAQARVGSDDPPSSQVTLLSGERLGAGVIDEGRLLRGARGGAGEMRYLEYVEGVGSTDGVALLARTWARDALARTRAPSRLRRLDGPAEAEDVFAAAAAGDELAAGIVERLGHRMARVVATLASVVDAEEVVFAGAVAVSLTPVLAIVERELPGYADPAPRVRACRLGSDVVVLGAVHRAIDHVRANRPAIRLPSRAE